MTTLQTIDYSGLSDTSPGTPLPNFDGGLSTVTTYLPSPAGNQPFISSHGWMCVPTAAGQIQGAYHQWDAGVRTTLISVSWMWTENKPGNNNGPVLCVISKKLSNSGGGLNVPPIAAHLGLGQQSWHLDVPGFFGFSTVAAGVFNPYLTYGVVYTVTLEYTAKDTIRLLLPDGSTNLGVQNQVFDSSSGTAGFTEIYLGNAIYESNVKIVREQMDTVQWPTSAPQPPPPPPPSAATFWEPYCRNHASALPQTSTESAAITAANAHVASNAGHVLEIREVVH